MGDDRNIMPLIDAANVACGGHAGDPSTTRLRELAKRIALKSGLTSHTPTSRAPGVGPWHLAARNSSISCTTRSALDDIAHSWHESGYVKPTVRCTTPCSLTPILNDIMSAVASWHTDLELVVLATPRDRKTQQLAVEHGLSLQYEAFADGAMPVGPAAWQRKPGALLNPFEAATSHRDRAKQSAHTAGQADPGRNADTLASTTILPAR